MPKDRSSTLGYALMGLLARESLSGYELSARLERFVGQFWSAHLSQIYPELARLERAGFVRHERVAQSDRPDKKVFELTMAGRERLSAWCTEPFILAPPKNELLVRTFSIWLADPAKAVGVYRGVAEHAEQRVRELEESQDRLTARFGADPPPTSRGFGPLSNVRFGIGSMKELARWSREIERKMTAVATEKTQPDEPSRAKKPSRKR